MSMDQSIKRRLSESLRMERLPQIDVTERVMDAIRVKRKPETGRRRLLAAGMAVAVLLACGFGYAAASWKIFSPDGAVALEYRQFLPGDEPAPFDREVLLRHLGEGEAGLFYLKDSGQFVSLANDIHYETHEAFAQKAGASAPPDSLGDGFAFQTGSVIHLQEQGAGPVLLAEMEREAQNSPDGIVFRKMPLGDEATGYYALYRNASGDEITVSGAFGERWRTMYADLDGMTMNKADLGGAEAFYFKDKSDGSHRIVWMKGAEDEAVYYTVRASSSVQVSEEQLVRIARVVASGASSE